MNCHGLVQVLRLMFRWSGEVVKIFIQDHLSMTHVTSTFSPSFRCSRIRLRFIPSQLYFQEAITLYEKLKRDAEEQTFRPEQARYCWCWWCWWWWWDQATWRSDPLTLVICNDGCQLVDVNVYIPQQKNLHAQHK